jgi:beta-aspartyl-peptidase (threonine type)
MAVGLGSPLLPYWSSASQRVVVWSGWFRYTARAEAAMKRTSVAVAAVLFLVIGLWAQAGKPSRDVDSETAIRAVLDAQVTAWNRHDLEGFMAGYWHSPELTFFSGDTQTKGWDSTLERYRRNYQSAGNEMGTLAFSDLRIEILASDAAMVRGRYQLAMKNGKQPQGLFTLIWKKMPDGWRIIHDHTSAACNGS